MNRAAFQHEAFGAVTRAAFDLEDLVRHLIVTLPRPVQATIEAAPGVEGPVDAAYFTAGVGDESRAGVAHPSVVGGYFYQADIAVVEARSGIVVLPGRHADGHRFKGGDGLGHCGE